MRIDTETIESLKIFLDGVNDIANLRAGLRVICREYLIQNIDHGLDEEISGAFLRDFDDLLDLLLVIERKV